MSRSLEIVHEGRVSRFIPTPIERKTLHGFKRRMALDELGNECASALLTRDGRFLLPAGSTADAFLDLNGDAVKRSELAAIDADGNPLPTLPATLDRPQAVVGPITPAEFLGHVATKVYFLEAETLDPVLLKALSAGSIFRFPYRPRSTHADTPAFLVANEHGVFLVQAEPCGFDFVGLEQTASEVNEEDERDADLGDGDEFAFDDWEANHELA